MVRKKAQLTELDHRYGETLKRIHEALHNLGLDSDRNKQKKWSTFIILWIHAITFMLK